MVLQLEGLSVRFGGVEALSGLDLGLATGEVLGLMGGNGCGKTTLFNAVTGVVQPSAGRILLLGSDITAAPVHAIARRGIARTFQVVRLFPAMTVAANVAPVDESTDAPSIRHALEQVGLAPNARALAGELSLTEQRRLEVARVLARNPRLVLMDEPTSGLGPKETEDMIRLLAETLLPGRTAIVAEHKSQVLSALCPRAVLLDQGRKVTEGAPAQLFAGLAAPEAWHIASTGGA